MRHLIYGIYPPAYTESKLVFDKLIRLQVSAVAHNTACVAAVRARPVHCTDSRGDGTHLQSGRARRRCHSVGQSREGARPSDGDHSAQAGILARDHAMLSQCAFQPAIIANGWLAMSDAVL